MLPEKPGRLGAFKALTDFSNIGILLLLIPVLLVGAGLAPVWAGSNGAPTWKLILAKYLILACVLLLFWIGPGCSMGCSCPKKKSMSGGTGPCWPGCWETCNTFLYEAYFTGAERDSIVTSFLVAKSFNSALVGKALAEGYIDSVDEPITNYIP